MELYTILEENKDFIAVNKHHGVLSQSGRDSSPAVIEELNKQNKYPFLHLLNRVDRPVGGVVLLAKSRNFLRLYLGMQEKNQVEKRYIALVEGVVDATKDSKVIKHYLLADRRRKKAIVSDKKIKGARAVQLRYQILKQFDRYTALEIILSGGKFHQIRGQLSCMGHPIRGDVKYGARRGNRDRSIGLHGHRISWSTKNSGTYSIDAPILKEDHLWQMTEAELRTKNSQRK